MTACIGLLKWFVDKYENGDKHDIQSPDGRVPYSVLQFAMDRCNEYVATEKHMDIDRDFQRIWDHEWDQFLSNFHTILHQDGLFMEFTESLTAAFGNNFAVII